MRVANLSRCFARTQRARGDHEVNHVRHGLHDRVNRRRRQFANQHDCVRLLAQHRYVLLRRLEIRIHPQLGRVQQGTRLGEVRFVQQAEQRHAHIAVVFDDIRLRDRLSVLDVNQVGRHKLGVFGRIHDRLDCRETHPRFLTADIQHVIVEIFVAGDHELALVRASAGRPRTIYVIPGIHRQPSCVGVMMPFDEGSPPGHPAFFVVSTTGGDVAADVAAVHDLQLALCL